MNIVELKNVTKKFGSLVAVDNFSLQIQPGTIFGLIGPNGAGKTTTMKMLVAVWRPTKSSMYIDGRAVDEEPIFTKSRLGYIPDDPFVYERMTGREYLSFVAEVFGIPKKECDERIATLSQLYPIAPILDGYMDNYSRGNKQKVVILAAFLHTPKVLLVDEPVVGLDPESIAVTKKLFRNFAKNDGGTVIISTHTLSVAQDICDRVGIIKEGKLIVEGTIEELQQIANEKNASLEDLYLHFVS